MKRLFLALVLANAFLAQSAHADSFGYTSSTFVQACITGTCSQRTGPAEDNIFLATNMDPVDPSYATIEYGGRFGVENSFDAFAFTRLASNGPTAGIQRDTATGLSDFQWWDTIHVNSDTLAAGTPVDLQFTLMLNATSFDTNSEASGTNSSFFQPLLPGASSLAFAGTNTNAAQEVQYLTVQAFVGSSFEITGDLTSDNAISPLVGEDVSAINEIYYFLSIDSDAPGVSLTSDSGRDYQTPVPEPSTFALLACGLTGMIRLLKR